MLPNMIAFLTISIFCFQYVSCANILYVSSVPSPSHHIWNKAISLALVKRGHNVTSIGPDADAAKIQNYTQILMEGLYEKLSDEVNVNDFASYGPLAMANEFYDWAEFSCATSLQTKGLQTLLNYPKDFKFDLIIFDLTVGPCYYPLLHAFNYPPAVAVTAFLLPSYASHGFGNHLHPAYIPWYSLPYVNDMTFFERVWNFMFTHIDLFLWDLQYNKQFNHAKKIFGDDIASLDVYQKHISLLLANTDPILNQPQPIPPNIIPVGGLHARKSNKLPQDLQEIMESSKHGVILFSLGTNVRSDKLGEQNIATLLDAFGKLRETVIWKFESDTIKDVPKNVIIRKWLPQNDLLGHPNTKLFIGHGGALSTQEAMFHGVPMIGVPFFVDQHINTLNLIGKKLGVKIDFKQMTPGYVLKQIREVLDNPIYRENMQRISRLFKDRLETPLERAVFWIEYVVRNKGAHFLETQAKQMSLVKAYGIDVVGFLAVLLFILVIIVWKVFLVILGLINRKDKVKVH